MLRKLKMGFSDLAKDSFNDDTTIIQEIVNNDGEFVACTSYHCKDQKDAEFHAERIIKSVNMHKQLIKICKLSLEGFEKGEMDTIDKACALIQHAIEQDKHYKY